MTAAYGTRGTGKKLAGLKGATIYLNPSDHPGMYVCRAWTATNGEVVASDNAVIFPTSDPRALDELRSRLAAGGAVRFPRTPQDDPAILETWM